MDKLTLDEKNKEAFTQDGKDDNARINELSQERIKLGEAAKEQEAKKDEQLNRAKQSIENIAINKNIASSVTAEERAYIDKHIASLKSEIGNKILSISKGNDTAADYDCHTLNYSTKTSLVKLDNGRRIFVVFNFPASWIHRKLDSLMKFLTDKKIKKANSKDWKETFERRTQIPTIPNNDPNVVVMDYIPNINLYDLFVNRKQKDVDGNPLIKNFGECDFAEKMDSDALLVVLEKVVDKTKMMHEENIHWGELNLPNIIIDKDQEVHICDPETEYPDTTSVAERRARDLFVFLMSSSSAMSLSENVDHNLTIKRILDRYGLDVETKNELKKLVEKPMTLLQKILFGYTKVNYGLKDKAEYEKILKNILDYLG